ncbi:MAG: hypothetical protein J5878_07410 [Oscillospiraceae bacterium]|nr:hypothetical protein [Oscillospiraceae bacterium]
MCTATATISCKSFVFWLTATSAGSISGRSTTIPKHRKSALAVTKPDDSGRLSCTYPAYGAGWSVTAQPDGTLTDENGTVYNYLYREGVNDAARDFSKGFCVRGADTADFLEDALSKLGLTRREANEFIVSRLPRMEDNAWNLISFQSGSERKQ